MQTILRPCGDNYYLQGHRNEESRLKQVLSFAKTQGYTKINVAYSGSYYELRGEDWYLTSDSDICDKTLGLPPDGLKICV